MTKEIQEHKPYFDDAFKNFWYDEQLVSYITQFMAVFGVFNVKIGQNDFDNQNNFIEVPIRYGGVDRVVDSIIAGQTQNSPLRLPMFSCKLADIQPAPERRKGTATVSRRSFLPRGAALPDGVKVMYRRTPQPYKLAFELNIFTSNDMQKFQIFEQILTAFDPSLQIQTSDDPFDGGKITVLTLENIGFEENYPAGNDRKINMSSMVFSCYAWLQVPIDFKDNFIKSIHVRLDILQNNKSLLDAIQEGIIDPSQSIDITIVDVDKIPDFPTG
jgi:hypothetical protein